jgi:hypothetical protein
MLSLEPFAAMLPNLRETNPADSLVPGFVGVLDAIAFFPQLSALLFN